MLTTPQSSARLNVIEGSGNGSITKAVADLVDSAPGALDTLNELAAAMGDDANFGTTVTNSIAAVQADVNANEAVSDARNRCQWRHSPWSILRWHH